jgi:hypothetical protein
MFHVIQVLQVMLRLRSATGICLFRAGLVLGELRMDADGAGAQARAQRIAAVRHKPEALDSLISDHFSADCSCRPAKRFFRHDAIICEYFG